MPKNSSYWTGNANPTMLRPSINSIIHSMTNTANLPGPTERIKHEPGIEDGWICICGNTPADDGFYPCDQDGNEIEPTVGSAWAGLYVCFKCGRIIDQETLEVVGKNPEPRPLT